MKKDGAFDKQPLIDVLRSYNESLKKIIETLLFDTEAVGKLVPLDTVVTEDDITVMQYITNTNNTLKNGFKEVLITPEDEEYLLSVESYSEFNEVDQFLHERMTLLLNGMSTAIQLSKQKEEFLSLAKEWGEAIRNNKIIYKNEN